MTLNTTPPLSVAYIAGSLCDAGHAVTVVDAVGAALEQLYESRVPPLLVNGLKTVEILERLPQDTQYVGISCLFTHEWPEIQALTRQIKHAFPHVRVILGGEHVTAVPEYSLTSCPEADAAVLGEGEETIVDLIDAFECGRDLSGVAGIAYRSPGGVIRTPRRSRIRQIDDIPPPRWDLIELEPYLAHGYSFGVNLGRTIPMLATRGCPFQCTFCSSPFMWTTLYETRDPNLVVGEIETYIRDYQVQNIDFYDLTAIIKREWIVEFCGLLKRRQLGITWQLPSGTRTEALDREVAELMKESGCSNLTYAPESGSRRVLKRIKKKIIPERMLKSMKDAVAAGLNAKVNIIFGFPDETLGDIMRTYKFILQMALAGVHDLSIWVYSPYPGCELFDLLKERGRIKDFDNEYFVSLLAYSDFTSIVSYDDYLSPRTLRYLRLGGMLLFYLTSYVSSPRRLVAAIRHIWTGSYVSRMEMTVGALFKRLRLERGSRAHDGAG